MWQNQTCKKNCYADNKLKENVSKFIYQGTTVTKKKCSQ